MICSCCGADKSTAALKSRSDVQLCRDCVEWLAGQLGVISTPTLPVSDIGRAVAFYEQAGFNVRIHEGGDFAFVDHDGQSVFDLDGIADLDTSANRAGCYLIVEDADAWHARLSDAGLLVNSPANQPWGMREFGLTDPFGNRIRIGSGLEE